MTSDKKEIEKIGKLAIPFVLAILLALILENVYESLSLDIQVLILGLLIFAIVLIYRKKFHNYYKR